MDSRLSLVVVVSVCLSSRHAGFSNKKITGDDSNFKHDGRSQSRITSVTDVVSYYDSGENQQEKTTGGGGGGGGGAFHWSKRKMNISPNKIPQSAK